MPEQVSIVNIIFGIIASIIGIGGIVATVRTGRRHARRQRNSAGLYTAITVLVRLYANWLSFKMSTWLFDQDKPFGVSVLPLTSICIAMMVVGCRYLQLLTTYWCNLGISLV